MKYFIRSADDLKAFMLKLLGMDGPFTVSISKGVKRTDEQNNTVHMWFAEIAKQRGDVTMEEVKAECNLEYGVPILMEADPEWAAIYGYFFKALDYERKLKAIRVMDIPFTRRMSVPQLNRYMTNMERDAATRGWVLTIPDERQMT